MLYVAWLVYFTDQHRAMYPFKYSTALWEGGLHEHRNRVLPIMTRRYIVQFDSTELPRIDTDFLVIGSGNAGLRAAIEANRHGTVLLITEGAIDTSSVQENFTNAIGENGATASHIEDTLEAGQGLCNETGVRMIVEDGVQQVSALIQCGRNLGKETETTLADQVQKQLQVQVIEHAFAIDFMTQEDRCYGVVALIDDVLHCIFAKATILASGGVGHIYHGTPNLAVGAADGLAAAWRAGCEVIDMEFIQFHPTMLFLMETPQSLITEQVREEGGILINSRGERFMPKYHGMEELAPCDVVSRAILTEIELTGTPCVYLDVTHLTSDLIQSRFSKIYQFCYQFGMDITTDVIPVRSGAYFMIGGVRTNLNAETNLRGLYACGEVACAGVHGASRLASNALLECIVFGARAGSAAAEYARTIESDSYANLRISSDDDACPSQRTSQNFEIGAAMESVQEMMWQRVGLFRHGKDLETISDELEELSLNCYWDSIEAFEFQNIRDAAALITEAASLRTESRGTHYREDFPEQDDVNWRKHIVLQQGRAARIVD